MSTVHKFLSVPFWVAVLFEVLGSAITFVPGAECDWFLVTAGLSVFGLFIPKTYYRVGAAALLILALSNAYQGYQHGKEYRLRFSTQHLRTP